MLAHGANNLTPMVSGHSMACEQGPPRSGLGVLDAVWDGSEE